VANCEVESKASDDDDEGWETGGQGGGLLSNAAMEAAAVRLFGRGGGSTQSLVPASMPAAAHSLHSRLHLLIAEVFLADSHVSPHFLLVWDAEGEPVCSQEGASCLARLGVVMAQPHLLLHAWLAHSPHLPGCRGHPPPADDALGYVSAAGVACFNAAAAVGEPAHRSDVLARPAAAAPGSWLPAACCRNA
jgi:hypothetical protein